MPNSEPANASEEPHWPGAGFGREPLDALPLCCTRPAARRCSACASRPAKRLRTCSRSWPAFRAPVRGGARASAATAATCDRRRGSAREFRYRARPRPLGGSAPSETAAEIGGADRILVPGCSTGGSGFGRSAARLYQDFGISRFVEHELDLIAHATPPRQKAYTDTIHNGVCCVNSFGRSCPEHRPLDRALAAELLPAQSLPAAAVCPLRLRHFGLSP